MDILLATYNGEKYISELLDSILSQTYQNWRVLVSDDCSSDATLTILRDYEARDSRIIIVSVGRKYGSAKNNFLSLLTYSSSELVMFCDQDDYWLPNKIDMFVRRYSKFRSLNKPVLLFSDMYVTNSNLDIIGKFMYSSKLDPERTKTNNLLALNCIPGCVMMLNRELVAIAKRTKNFEGIVMHDVWIALLGSIFGKIDFIDSQTILYRQHSANSIGSKRYIRTVFNSLFDENRSNILRKTIWQAQALIREYSSDLDDESYTIIKAYSKLDRFSRFKKVIICTRYGFWKYGIARKVDQLLNL